MKDSKTLDDLLTIVTFLDERGMGMLLPRYVADNPDSLPSPRLCEGELLSLTKKMNSLTELYMGLQAQLDKVLDVSRNTAEISRSTADISRSTAEAVNGCVASNPEFPPRGFHVGERDRPSFSLNS